MKRIFSILFAVVLVLSFSLIPATPVAANEAPSVTLDIPENVYRPVTFDATSTTTNPTGGTSYTSVRFNITVSGPEAFTGAREDIFTITQVVPGGVQGINETFVLVDGDFVGYWGPASGFPLPADYSVSSTFTVQMNDGGTAPVGNYEVSVELVDLTPDPDVTLASATDGFSLSADTLHVGAGQQFTTIQDAVDAAGSGDTIIVAAGTYTQDLTIPATKTNLELTSASGAAVTIIKGVQEQDWPTHAPAISILASGVKIHGFTIESPSYSRTSGNPHSSGIAVGAANVEIYENEFKSVDDSTGNSLGWCTSIETYGVWAGDVSGLCIHDNNFTSMTGTDKGSEGIYINYNPNNPTPAGTVTIANNTFGGQIFRAISTERSRTTIRGNIINSSYAPNPAFNAALRGIDVWSPGANLNPNQDTVVMTGNTVNGFWQGIRLGSANNNLTNITVNKNMVKMNTTGIRVYSSASGIVVNYNNISGNTLYGVDNIDTTNNLDALYNWWGDCSGPGPVGPGSGDSVSANVLFEPWLGKALCALKIDIAALSDDDFTKPKAWSDQKQALLDKVDAVCGQIENGAYRGALNKLEKDITRAIQRWIVSDKQGALIAYIDAEIEILEGAFE